jgi:hypothetical protein
MARNVPIQILRTTRANLDAQAGASGLLAGEPYLVTDARCLAVGTGTNAYALAGKSTLDQIAGLNPTLDLDFANQVYRHYSPATGLREKALSDIVSFTRASTATYFDAKGIMQTAASGAPRIDFDPATGECKGLLIEEARTNRLTYSADFSNPAWLKVNCTTSVPSVAAPDGSATSTKFTYMESVTFSSVGQTVSAAGNNAFSFSMYFNKASTSTFAIFALFCLGNAVQNGSFTFNPQTGVIADQPQSGVALVTFIGGDWYRVSYSFTGTNPSNTSAVANVYFYPGETICWGAQLEVGAFPTSYIKTEAQTATRAADVAVISGTAFSDFYRQGAGTVLHRCRALASISGKYLLDINDGTYNQSINIVLSPPNFMPTVVDGGLIQMQSARGTNDTNITTSMAFALANNDFACSVSGGAIGSDLSGTVPIVNRMQFASRRVDYLEMMSLYLSRFAYFPKRLSNATLQQLTAG